MSPAPEIDDYTAEDARAAFPLIYGNAAIATLAAEPRWTVSDSSKKPVDMRHLFDGCNRGCQHQGPVRGAWATDERCLVTLDELTENLPRAANRAFWLRGSLDGVLVLDIEPACPPEEAARLLSLPGALYAERSMSGRGFHVLMPLPANFRQFPVAAAKVKLRHSHGWWEVLIEHWATFTGVPVGDTSYLGAPAPGPCDWEGVYAELAVEAVEVAALNLDVDAERPEIFRREQVLEIVTRDGCKRDPESFHGDMSRFEFSVMGVLYNRLRNVLNAVESVTPDYVYDDTAVAWLLYDAATTVLEHRPKHDELRNGMPLLLNSAVALIAQRLAEAENEGNER